MYTTEISPAEAERIDNQSRDNLSFTIWFSQLTFLDKDYRRYMPYTEPLSVSEVKVIRNIYQQDIRNASSAQAGQKYRKLSETFFVAADVIKDVILRRTYTGGAYDDPNYVPFAWLSPDGTTLLWKELSESTRKNIVDMQALLDSDISFIDICEAYEMHPSEWKHLQTYMKDKLVGACTRRNRTRSNTKINLLTVDMGPGELEDKVRRGVEMGMSFRNIAFVLDTSTGTIQRILKDPRYATIRTQRRRMLLNKAENGGKRRRNK